MSKQHKTTKQNVISKAGRLNMIRQKMNKLKKQEKELKEFFTILMEQKDTETIIAGDYVIVQKDGYSTLFDKAMLQKEMGVEFVSKYQYRNEYKKLEVKKCD